jgi:uncharacterized repeat protein (TIGR04138 family)
LLLSISDLKPQISNLKSQDPGPMPDPSHSIARLLEEDRRYPVAAYAFIFDALRYAHEVLHLGTEPPNEPKGQPPAKTAEPGAAPEAFAVERHVTGQELCEAIRCYALEQYGYMAETVLNNWGIRETGDFGEIVFNLIRVGQMRKTSSDARADFNDVYDFDTAFRQAFKLGPARGNDE